MYDVIRTVEDLADVPQRLDATDSEEFAISQRFDREFFVAVCRHGFLPMAAQTDTDTFWFLVKCHRQREVLDFPNLHISRSTRRAARGKTITINGNFPAVIDGITAAHEQSWLLPPYVELLFDLYAHPEPGFSVCSFEVYDEETLVAGEVGYQCGSVYTSLSGFYTASGAGMVQLCATARLLESAEVAFWDLGMVVPYKEQIGARRLDRYRFLERFCAAAAEPPAELPSGHIRECRLLLS